MTDSYLKKKSKLKKAKTNFIVWLSGAKKTFFSFWCFFSIFLVFLLGAEKKVLQTLTERKSGWFNAHVFFFFFLLMDESTKELYTEAGQLTQVTRQTFLHIWVNIGCSSLKNKALCAKKTIFFYWYIKKVVAFNWLTNFWLLMNSTRNKVIFFPLF